MTDTKFIVIVETESLKEIHRVDVSGKSLSAIERIENGMNINLNHSKYHTEITEDNVEKFSLRQKMKVINE